jgi:hypothetical protein
MRLLTAILAAAFLVAAFTMPAAAAKPPSKKLPPALVKAVSSPVEQGDYLAIVATVKAPKGTMFSGTATVHFASGDVEVVLNQVKKSPTARARTPVGVDEATGSITVDATVTAVTTSGATTWLRTITVEIVPPALVEPAPEPVLGSGA